MSMADITNGSEHMLSLSPKVAQKTFLCSTPGWCPGRARLGVGVKAICLPSMEGASAISQDDTPGVQASVIVD